MSRQAFSDLSDQKLIELCLARGAKDDRPFSELFRRHQAIVWRVCYRFMGNSQDAEDLTQEVFFKAYRKLDQFEGRSALSTWLYRIAVTTCLNEKRRRSRRPSVTSTSIDDMAESLAADSSEERWLTQIQQSRLLDALNKLNKKQREILQLRDFEQLSYKEISQKLGISLSATKMRIQRARLALQTIYRKLEKGNH
ncbi:MAG: RNA polymerase sigma factor [Ardenticatenaceae bacterium]